MNDSEMNYLFNLQNTNTQYDTYIISTNEVELIYVRKTNIDIIFDRERPKVIYVVVILWLQTGIIYIRSGWEIDDLIMYIFKNREETCWEHKFAYLQSLGTS